MTKPNELITRREVEAFKREILESTVLVNINTAASILAVHPRTILRRVEEGRLTPYNDNRTRKHMRFLASELKRYVREMRKDAQ